MKTGKMTVYEEYMQNNIIERFIRIVRRIYELENRLCLAAANIFRPILSGLADVISIIQAKKKERRK